MLFRSADIKFDNLTVEHTTTPGEVTAPEKLVFGKQYADHMLEVIWTAEAGWGAPKIVPFHDLVMSPATSCLHYGLEGFEGMKAYKRDDGMPLLFRPIENMKRLNTTSQRMCMPAFDSEEMLKCIAALVKLDHRWIPQKRGYSLYLRPTVISLHPTLGVSVPAKVMIFVIMSPVGPYFKEGFKAIPLLAQTEYVRAFPGGSGDVKCGGNYGPTILPMKIAASQGCSQVLWLFGEDCKCTEVGTMNFFIVIKPRPGSEVTTKYEVVTAPLDGTILPGITRRSVMEMIKTEPEFAECTVTERDFTMFEIIDAVKEGRMVEAFGTGTACIVTPVDRIKFKGEFIPIPTSMPDTPDAGRGLITDTVYNKLMDIQYGVVESEWMYKCQ